MRSPGLMAFPELKIVLLTTVLSCLSDTVLGTTMAVIDRLYHILVSYHSYGGNSCISKNMHIRVWLFVGESASTIHIVTVTLPRFASDQLITVDYCHSNLAVFVKRCHLESTAFDRIITLFLSTMHRSSLRCSFYM